MDAWGLSSNIDVRGCDPALIRSAAHIQDYVIQLCKLINMTRYGDIQIHRFGTDNKEGYSFFQLIETSNISGHFSEELNIAFIDIFSCREYDVEIVKQFTLEFFKGAAAYGSYIYRGEPYLTRDAFYHDQGCKL